MSAAQQAGALAGHMKQVGDGVAWAKTPPARGARGSLWESRIIELAESGDQRFLQILAEHVALGVIRSERARQALEAAGYDAIAA
ncbi:hypothetical protein B447_10803 [Thauera sp. 27]|uniref:hypothetical protein n=1 Tax=Thauera sp. 27 TaxID=305700 RepID=UPI0002CF5D02|nr:hypothetical protein [Thauera sp. 27]ENO80950.1 hypothetical protein B447_10803 [Thauera sp. 27]